MLCPNPECKEKVTQLKEGRFCPHCWLELRRATLKRGEKVLLRIGEDAPPTALMKHWMACLSVRLSRDHGRSVPFDIHPMREQNKYMREIAMAEVLLSSVQDNLPLAKRAIAYVVDNEFKAPITLTWVTDAFAVAKFIVADAIEDEKKPTSQDHTLSMLEGMEDVWD